ncbi:MAG: T9SS type A sorting domain-containing protein [Bacteroidetes bacterium]|nr:T9SS type A sorting domain-containing protein [Bacteroidota bacterium]
MKKNKLIILILLAFIECKGQGYNFQWLLGYGNWANKGRIVFDITNYSILIEQRKMKFNGTQGNICDANGNFLMSSNGVWVANANNDTMLNGAGLNPGNYVNTFPNGLYIDHNNIFVPYPGDSLKYFLIHHTGSPNIFDVPSLELFYSVIDITRDNGLGAVDSNFKNVSIFQDTISWGIAMCKHANGRDWWIITLRDGYPVVHINLFSNSGIILNTTQTIGTFITSPGNVCSPAFSKNGDKFAFTIYDNDTSRNSSIVLSNFDRCNGVMFNTQVIPITSNQYLSDLTFSPSGDFIYSNSINELYQINVNTLIIDTVAIYDGFSFPIPSAVTNFGGQYLAANGKIYLTANGSAQHIHEINNPDSTGLACDVQQHAINLGVWHFRSVPNHPNYNLGPVVGSACDTLTIIGIEELKHDFKFNISPNPTSDGYIKLVYLLPQNKQGVFEVYNMTGQRVYEMNLPPWSTLQFVQLPELSNGVYTCVVRSGYERVGKKLVIIR